MRELLQQIQKMWVSLSAFQKGGALLLASSVLGVFCYFICVSNSHYVLLDQGALESDVVEAYLYAERTSFEKKGESTFFVLKEEREKLERALRELNEEGSLSQGFELFDTNTWIKGEKELQVLEMRALKGQLERDLTSFEKIKQASVILDLAPQKTFGEQKNQTKASVILVLKPYASLSQIDVRAITNHLSGAVRGLETHRIALSDSRGRLYQAISDEAVEQIDLSHLYLEEELHAKVMQRLISLVGEEKSSLSLKLLRDESGEWKRGALSMVVEVVEDKKEEIKAQITRALDLLEEEYACTFSRAIDWKYTSYQEVVEKKNTLSLGFYLAAGITLLLFSSLFLFIKTRPSKKKKRVTQIDFAKLAKSLDVEDPKSLAWMLSYLEPARAEQILSALPTDAQEAVIKHLYAFEGEGS